MKDLPFTQSVSTLGTAHCLDCGAPVSGNYCAHCGQETLIETPTVRQFLHELADQYVAVEGKLGRTLRVLLSRPGQLTVDYLEGRRQRYVRPLKLYLSVSVVFFGLLGLTPDSVNPFANVTPEAQKEAQQALDDAQKEAQQEQAEAQKEAQQEQAEAQKEAQQEQAGAQKEAQQEQAEDNKDKAPGAKPAHPAAAAPSTSGSGGEAAPAAPSADDPNLSLKQQIDAQIAAAVKDGDTRQLGQDIKKTVDTRLKKDGDDDNIIARRAKGFAKLPAKQQSRLLRAELADKAPYAMFFLLPYFALLLSWMYRKNRLRYGAHLLFSIHLHCFVFILLMVGFLPLPSSLRTAMWLAVVVYLFLALRRAYGGSWRRTVWREAVLSGLYMIAVAASAVSGVLSAVFSGGNS